MSEFRMNPITREWVIFAPERAGRPEGLLLGEPDEETPPAWDPACPFCPGNEWMTPPEVYRDPPCTGGGEGEAPWRVRVFPNKYPAVRIQAAESGREPDEPGRPVSGIGVHEVVVEHPAHDRSSTRFTPMEQRRVLTAYQSRYKVLRRMPQIRLITIFKNHGRRAGASLAHPHAQILGTFVLPEAWNRALAWAEEFYRGSGRSIFSDVVDRERQDGSRIVVETDHYVAFCPYASHSPFQVTIFPVRPSPSFGAAPEDEIEDLGDVLTRILAALRDRLQDPPLNYVIRSAPLPEKDGRRFVWHVEVIPRITVHAGFELGWGMAINVVDPEEAAADLRRRVLPPD